MQLSELKSGEKAIIQRIKGQGTFKRRLVEMGFVRGQEVSVVKSAPLQDPIEYELMGYKVSLRRIEADQIDIAYEDDYNPITSHVEVIETNSINKVNSKTIRIALVGNPNAGKTTLFNYASGAREHVGNYSGVTVDSKTATLKKFGYTFHITDLPGAYSLSANNPEEIYTRKHLLEQEADFVLNIVDASNLERNLFLTTQLIDMGLDIVVALNMFDELEGNGNTLDYEGLSAKLGIPLIPTVSSKGRGIEDLFKRIISLYEGKEQKKRTIIRYDEDIENTVEAIEKELISVPTQLNGYPNVSSRFTALKLIEGDQEFTDLVQKEVEEEQSEKVLGHVDAFGKCLEDDGSTHMANVRYSLIENLLGDVYSKGITSKQKFSERFDKLLTHKYLGFPIFIGFMWLMFQATFTLGQYPMDWIELGVAQLGELISTTMAEGPLKGLLVDGILGGVGGVIVFLPNILILFLFISLMEDTGYMARAVFIMDKLMHKIGLHGKSFIPMVMGFGCNVPAVMATRTLGNRNDRLLTMLINPFMSCSARLPVYILIIGAFFPNTAGTMLFLMYFIGISLAVIMALIFKKLLFKTSYTPFVMELPPFRVPTLKTSVKHMWNKGSQYLKKMGGVILVASIIIWALGYYPREANYSVDYDAQIELAQSDQEVAKLELLKESERFEQSFIGKAGQFIEPVISPLGFDWKMGVSLLTGFAAKEIVVSTMGVLYQADAEADETSGILMDKLKNHRLTRGPRKGELAYTPLVAFSFMLFVLIYFPCVSTIAAINSESGSRKWAFFSMVYPTVLAWILSFIVYQTGSLLF